MSTVICLCCASTFTDDARGRFITCPTCSFAIGRGRYRKIMQWSFEAVRYGFEYRKIIEQSAMAQDQTSEKAKFCIADPDPILVFVATAAASGIIGNVASDLVKAAIRKILARAAEFRKEPKEETVKILTQEEEYQQFLCYLEEFYQGMRNVDQRIREKILEEVLGDRMADYAKNALEKYDPLDPTKLKFDLNKVIQKMKNRDVPAPADFRFLWKNVREDEISNNEVDRAL